MDNAVPHCNELAGAELGIQPAGHDSQSASYIADFASIELFMREGVAVAIGHRKAGSMTDCFNLSPKNRPQIVGINRKLQAGRARVEYENEMLLHALLARTAL